MKYTNRKILRTMFLQHIRVFLIVGADRSWIEGQTEKLESEFSKSVNTSVRRTRILEYPEYLNSQSIDVEQACLSRVLFVFRNFREECAERRSFGILIIDGYIMGNGVISRLISYLNMSSSIDSIEQIFCQPGTMPQGSESLISKTFLPYCGSYHYMQLDQKISEITSLRNKEIDWLLIYASRHTHSLVLYSCESHEFFVVYSPIESTKDKKSYKLLETEIGSMFNHDSILALRLDSEYRDKIRFTCSKVYSCSRGNVVRPKDSKISINDIEINFATF